MITKNYLIHLMDFAEWLKTYRKAANLSLRKLADRINNLCSDAYLSQLENRRYVGKKGNTMQPDLEIVDALAVALNRPVNEARLAAGYAPITQMTVPEEIASIDFSAFEKKDLKEIADFINYLLFKKGVTRTEQPTHPVVLRPAMVYSLPISDEAVNQSEGDNGDVQKDVRGKKKG
jgi:transcriptional regulator with XRE-family HTH domain